VVQIPIFRAKHDVCVASTELFRKYSIPQERIMNVYFRESFFRHLHEQRNSDVEKIDQIFQIELEIGIQMYCSTFSA